MTQFGERTLASALLFLQPVFAPSSVGSMGEAYHCPTKCLNTVVVECQWYAAPGKHCSSKFVLSWQFHFMELM